MNQENMKQIVQIAKLRPRGWKEEVANLLWAQFGCAHPEGVKHQSCTKCGHRINWNDFGRGTRTNGVFVSLDLDQARGYGCSESVTRDACIFEVTGSAPHRGAVVGALVVYYDRRPPILLARQDNDSFCGTMDRAKALV